MITEEQATMMNNLLTSENIDEVMNLMMHSYGSSVEHFANMQKLIPVLTTKILFCERERRYEYEDALKMMTWNWLHPEKRNEDTLFIAYYYFCKANFPQGICESESSDDKKIFDSFINMLKNWENRDIENWCSVVGGTEWMLKLIQKNIDPGFGFAKYMTE